MTDLCHSVPVRCKRRKQDDAKRSLEVLPSAPEIRVSFSSVKDMLTCGLCKGYLHNAVTITECLHSFCKGCLVRYVGINLLCPTCKVLIHPTDPLVNIRPDSTIQDILYKLVPGVEEEAKRKERDFYQERGIEFPLVKENTVPVKEGRMSGNQFDSQTEEAPANQWLAVILLYAGKSSELELHRDLKPLVRNYLWVPGYASIANVQNFLRKKLSLDQRAQAYLFYETYLLNESLTLNKINEVFYDGDTDELMTLHYGVLPNKNYFLQDVDDYEVDYEDEVDASDDDYNYDVSMNRCYVPINAAGKCFNEQVLSVTSNSS